MAFLQRTANRGSVSTGYDIDNSLKLEADNSEYLYKANNAGTNRKTFTVSMWFKRTELANDYMQLWQGGENGEATRLGFYGGTPKEAIWVDVGGGTGNTGSDYRSYSVQVLRDTSAWYHIVLAVDTTQSTAADRLKVWLNGDEITTWTNQAIPAQDFQCSLEGNSGVQMKWGAYNSTYYKMCGYIAECHYLDGVAKAQTDFGEYDEDSGIWKPKAYTGSYGGNGCYLNFDDSSDLGADSSGNGNDFTSNNITSADQSTDTPTNNFATFNVAQPRQSGTTIAEGGTEMYVNSNYQTAVSSIAVSSGKWYAEFIAGGGNAMVGFVDVTEWTIPQLHNGFWLGYDGTGNTLSVGMKGSDGVIYNESNSATGATFGNADVLSVALDMDNRKAYFAVNGTWVNSGNPATAANPILWYTQRADGTPWTDVITMGITGNSNTYPRCNFGGYSSVVPSSPQSDANGYGTFEYAPPSGYYALCGKNLAEYGGTA